MTRTIIGALGAVLLLASATGAVAAPAAPAAAPAGSHISQAAWVLRCHTVWVRRHRHHHPGWHRVPARSCHRVRI